MTATEWEALLQGQVLINEIVDEHGVPGVKAMFLVRANRDVIWATLIDYDNFPQFFTDIKKMQVLDYDADGASVEFWMNAILPDLHYVLDRRYIEPGYRLTWKRTSGDLKIIHGSWQILDTPDPERKLLVYESFVDIGFSVVTWVIRKVAKKKARQMGERMRAWIERE